MESLEEQNEWVKATMIKINKDGQVSLHSALVDEKTNKIKHSRQPVRTLYELDEGIPYHYNFCVNPGKVVLFKDFN